MSLPIPTGELEIANMALDELGQASITDFTSTDTGALMARHFASVRQSLLRKYVWNWAKKRASCPRTRTPEFDWKDAYATPADFLRLLNFSASASPASERQRQLDYDLENNPNTGAMEILCNASSSTSLSGGNASNVQQWSVTLTGSNTTGDQLKIIFAAANLVGSPLTKAYTTTSGDSLSVMASKLAVAINTDSNLRSLGIYCNSSNNIITVTAPLTLSVAITTSVTGAGTEVITVQSNANFANTISLRYVADIQDPSKWDSLFRRLMVLNLALVTGYQITKDESIVKRVNELINVELPDAISIDGQENPPIRVERSRFINARVRGSMGGSGVASPYTHIDTTWD